MTSDVGAVPQVQDDRADWEALWRRRQSGTFRLQVCWLASVTEAEDLQVAREAVGQAGQYGLVPGRGRAGRETDHTSTGVRARALNEQERTAAAVVVGIGEPVPHQVGRCVMKDGGLDLMRRA